MDVGGTTWIVTADVEEARFFEERARAGDVHELPALHMTAKAPDSARDPEVKHEAEHKFMRKVAAQLVAAAGKHEFDSLVLMMPPRILGALRSELPTPVLAKIEATDPHERRHDRADEVRRHLREARAKIRA